jgi:hypothetical protein
MQPIHTAGHLNPNGTKVGHDLRKARNRVHAARALEDGLPGRDLALRGAVLLDRLGDFAGRRRQSNPTKTRNKPLFALPVVEQPLGAGSADGPTSSGISKTPSQSSSATVVASSVASG